MKSTTSLKKNHEFKRLYNKGKSAASQCAVVYCIRTGKTRKRLGITVSAKIGGAVQRNRIRRRLKEIYRLNEDKIKPGYDIVIVARTRSRYAEYKEIESSVITLFKKLNIWSSDIELHPAIPHKNSGGGG
ncbi:MAG: ribonuclease P protein component [Oscillospiraceae bacterium]|nr:ribonuclease P protein component [Oscillospiraceae bacterium]